MSQATDPEVPFEKALTELEQVVRDLEDGHLGLDDSLARYEKGVALIQLCHARLQVAEQRILQLTRVEPEDRPVLAPFVHEATARTGGSLARSRTLGENGGHG